MNVPVVLSYAIEPEPDADAGVPTERSVSEILPVLTDPSAIKNWADVPPVLTNELAVAVAALTIFLLSSIIVEPDIFIAI